MMSEGYRKFVTAVGTTTVGAGDLLGSDVTPNYPASSLRITFVGNANSTLAITGLGNGAAGLLNSGATITAHHIKTFTLAVRDTMSLNFQVSAAGTYTLLVEERAA